MAPDKANATIKQEFEILQKLTPQYEVTENGQLIIKDFGKPPRYSPESVLVIPRTADLNASRTVRSGNTVRRSGFIRNSQLPTTGADKKGDYDRAIRDFDHAVRLDPRNA